jgi:carboxymethylenebutenolidase
MGRTISLKSPLDGFEFYAYHAPPEDARQGGLVVIQEIFGVTEHIRDIADSFAADGYEVLAPSLYDRLHPEYEAEYDEPETIQQGVEYSQATPWDQVAADLQAVVDQLKPPVFVVGYCWGGTATWLAACRCKGVTAVSAYYGRRIPELIDETPACPIILHFGKADASIPMETVEAIRAKHPDIPIYLYDAGHGFASDRRKDYHHDSAKLARLRTLKLFARPGGSGGEV